MQQTDERKWEGNEPCPGHNANEKPQSNQRSRREIRSPVSQTSQTPLLPALFSCNFPQDALPGHNIYPIPGSRCLFSCTFPQKALHGHNIYPGSRCCAIEHVSREPTHNAAVESALNGKIEMFGLQGSSSSPTDPLFTRLSQDCPIRGPRHANTTPFVSMQPLSMKKRECVRRPNEKTGCERGLKYRQLETCPRKQIVFFFVNVVYQM